MDMSMDAWFAHLQDAIKSSRQTAEAGAVARLRAIQNQGTGLHRFMGAANHPIPVCWIAWGPQDAQGMGCMGCTESQDAQDKGCLGCRRREMHGMHGGHRMHRAWDAWDAQRQGMLGMQKTRDAWDAWGPRDA
eukprot:1158294-Pelagomonas_calceolata.AAC.4